MPNNCPTFKTFQKAFKAEFYHSRPKGQAWMGQVRWIRERDGSSPKREIERLRNVQMRFLYLRIFEGLNCEERPKRQHVLLHLHLQSFHE